MNNIIAYDTVKKLVENPPSLGDRPDFFNLRELRNHFARKLKSLECPQSPMANESTQHAIDCPGIPAQVRA